MNLSKALQILGLTKNFTEDELKKQYRKLIAKYHPDLFETKSEELKKQAEEKTKEINAAREYLTKYLKDNSAKSTFNNRTYGYNNKKNYTYDNRYLIQTKEKFRTKISNMKIELYAFRNIKSDILLKNTTDKLLHEIEITLDSLDDANTIFTLNLVGIMYYNKIKTILAQFKEEYRKKYNITIYNRELESYSLKILYAQLEQIRKEQKAFTVEEILDAELNKYICYPGYSDIKDLIDIIKYKLIYKNSDVKDSNEAIINEFNKKVLNEFNEYYKRLKILNEFRDLNLTLPRLKTLLIELKKNIGNPEKFKYYETQLINALAESMATPETISNNKFIMNNKKINNYIETTENNKIKKK